MAAHDDVALCPLIYGYVNYAAPASGTKPIAFTDAPRETADSAPGSTLGGTGIGISARCAVTPGLLAHLRWLMSDAAQRGFIPAHDRSEEHTSELQSLMRRSYAVFCLKKKTTAQNHQP